MVVNRIMKNSAPSIVDPNFTANMESLLDKVADGTVAWKTVVKATSILTWTRRAVKTAEKGWNVKIADERYRMWLRDLYGRQMVIKYGPHGKFLACPGFPECKNTKPYLEKNRYPMSEVR